MARKCHLDLKPKLSPATRGFKKGYSLLPGCTSHYDWEPQLSNPRYIPSFFETAVTALHTKGMEYIKKPLEPFYSSSFYAGKIIEYIGQGRESGDDIVRGRPFFAYLPFSAPHWPLQTPQKNIEMFKGRYEAEPVQSTGCKEIYTVMRYT